MKPKRVAMSPTRERDFLLASLSVLIKESVWILDGFMGYKKFTMFYLRLYDSGCLDNGKEDFSFKG